MVISIKIPKKETRTESLFRGKYPSVWSFWDHGVSSSILALFLACREQARIKLIRGYTSITDAPYFAFGKCCHYILFRVYGEFSKPPSIHAVEKIAGEYKRLWIKQNGNPPQSLLEEREKLIGLAAMVCHAYFIRWAGDFPSQKYPLPHKTAKPKRWISLEKRYSVLYEYPDGKKVPIVGTRDCIFESDKRKEFILDTKCYSIITPDDIADTLSVDLQLMLYIWSYYKETGVFPYGAIKNVIRRPKHIQSQGESLKRFLMRIHDEAITKKKMDHFFQRYQVELIPSEIEAWEQSTLVPIMEDIRAWWEGKAPHYMNPNSLISKYGRCETFDAVVNNNFSYLKRVKDVMAYQTQIG